MNGKERSLALLSGDESAGYAAINPTSIATEETCRTLGISLPQAHLDADRLAALAAYGAERLGFDSVMPYVSVAAEAASLGFDVDWGSNTAMPAIKGRRYADPEEFLLPADFLDSKPARTVLDAIGLLSKKLGGRALIIGKVMGPWTLCYHLHGLEDFLMDLVLDPVKAKEFLSKTQAITTAFAAAQLEAGADVMTLADHATADLIGPQTYRDFLLPIHKQITRAFPANTFILHCCGYTQDRVRYFQEAGFNAFHFDSKNDINAMRALVSTMRLTGCVNNPETLLTGTPEQVGTECRRIMDAGIRLLSPECAIPLQTANENLLAVSRAAHERNPS